MSSGAFDWSFRARGAQDAGVLLGILEKLDAVLGVLTQREQATAQSLNQLGSTFARMGGSIDDLASKLATYGKIAGDAVNYNSSLQQSIDNSVRTNNTYKTSIDNSASTVNDYSAAIDNSVKNHQKYDNRIDASTSIQQKYDNRVDESISVQQKYDQRIDSSIRNHQKYDNRVDNSTTVINKFGAATTRTSGSVGGLFMSLTRAAGIWNTWNKAVDFAQKRVGQFIDLLIGWEKTLRSVGGEFERSEATLRVLGEGAGSSGEEVDALVKKVKELGKTTEFTASQAAEGAITLLKGGNDASQSVEKLDAALAGALATGLDFDQAAKVGTIAWNIFGDNLGKVGKEPKNFATALKTMVAAANASDAEVTELSGSLSRGGNIMAGLGVSLTRTTTALGLLANDGVKGERAMTLLSISCKRLVDGTKPAAKALKEIGVEATDEKGQMKDLGVLMQEIGDKLDLKKPSEQIKLMKDLFGAGDKVMRTLLDAGIKGFDQMESSIEKAMGTMDQLKNARSDTIVGAWKSFQSAVESVWVELVAVLRVPVIAYWDNLASILRKVSDRISEVGKRFKANAGGLEDWIKLIKSGGLEGLFQGLVQELEPEIQKIEMLWKAFVTAMSALMSEIWDAFMNSAAYDRIKEFAKNIGKAILEGIKMGIGEDAFEKLLTLGQTVADTVGAAKKTAGTIVDVVKNPITQGVAATAAALTGPIAAAGVAGGYAVSAGALAYGALEERGGRKEQIGTLEAHLEKMKAKKAEVLAIPLISMTDEDYKRLGNINEQIAQSEKALNSLNGVKPTIEVEVIPPDMAPVTDAIKSGSIIDWGGNLEQIDTLEKHLGAMQLKKDKLSQMPVELQTEDAQKHLQNVNKEIEQTQQSLEKLKHPQAAQKQATPTWSTETERALADVAQVGSERAKQAADAKAKKDAERQKILDEQAPLRAYFAKGSDIPQFAKTERISTAGTAEDASREALKTISDEEIKATQDVLGAKQQITDEEKKYQEALEQSKNILLETNVAINDISSNFEQWLLNPVNVFQQKLLEVKQSFGDLKEGFQGKKIDIAEKFGLKTPEEATQARKDVAEKGLKRDEDLLKLAQTPEEQMKIRERMAGKAEKLAEMTTGGEQKGYADKAVKFLEEAEKAGAKAEELEIKRLQIQQDYAKKNLAEYEAMVGNATTAGGKAAALELSQQAYMALGPEYADQASKATEELKVAKAEAATEESERLKIMAENSTLQVELLTRQLEVAEEQLSTTRTRQQIPQSKEYADDAG